MSAAAEPGAWFNWHECLEPDEKILWQGQPRDGAGWRCVLREDRLRLLLSLAAAAVVAAMLAGGASATEGADIGFAVLGLFGLGLFVWGEGHGLAAMRYAVTDRRCLSVDLAEHVMLAVRHETARPVRRETPCGTLIDLGKPERFAWIGRSGWVRRKDEDSETYLRYWALDPDTAPFATVVGLSRDAAAARRASGRLRGLAWPDGAPVPGMTDYVPPVAASGASDPTALAAGREAKRGETQAGGAT